MKNAVQADTLSTEPNDYVVPAADRRKQDRHIAMLRLAKIRAQSGEGWGFIKNLSATGMMLEVHSNFDLGNQVSAVLSEDQELTGTVRWRDQSQAGVEFFEPINVADLLSKPTPDKSGRVPRLPRIAMQHPINLYLGSKLIQGSICDISPAGICVSTDHSFEMGKSLRLSVPDLMDVSGTVRWQLDDRVGIVFSQRLPLDDLMTWLSTFYKADKFEDRSLVALNHDGGSTEPASAASDSLLYQVIGHDDRDEEILIDKVGSATEALLQFKATSKFFYRVTVRDANNAPLSIGTIVLRASDEELASTRVQSS